MLYKDINNNETEFKYTWRFVPYDTKSPKFRLALHITPTSIYEFKTYKDFPELEKVISRILKLGRGVSSKLVPAIVLYEFDKEHNDIIDTINEVKEILNEAGIQQGKYVDLYSGFPNIFYGEEYLSHTVGCYKATLTDIISAMVGKVDVREQFGTMPVVGTQKFDEYADTDTEYLSTLLEREANRLKVRTMRLKSVVKDVIQSRHVQESLNNMYSTDKGDSWSNFQGMF